MGRRKVHTPYEQNVPRVVVAKKKMTQRRAASTKDSDRRKSGGSAFNKRLLFVSRHIILWLVIGLGAYWLWLDREVAQTFETRRWSLPARVYARPLELYPGAVVSHQRLIGELENLGYERSDRVQRRGQYSVSSAHIEFLTRGFEYWDLPEYSRHARVVFGATGIAEFIDVSSGTAIDLMRLEPVEVGRLNPLRFEDRQLLSFEELPPRFVAALVALEDHRFFAHFGVDVFGLARAMLSNLRAMRFVQGGSTLTQQLVKNFYLTRERTLRRKLTEMLMSFSLELRYDKTQILETYVNEVFLAQDGNRAVHGFGLAAQFYFGKPLSELDMPSLATLIGLVKGPTVYDPRRRPAAALKRRNVVLSVLHQRGLIDRAELAMARAQAIGLRSKESTAATGNPAFLAQVKRQLLREYSADDLKSAGLNIFTTLDIALQASAEQATKDTLHAIESSNAVRDLQAAMVIAEPRSGEILAMIGGREPHFAGFNRALDARRPVGSVIKPFVYAYALSRPQDYSLATMLRDTAVSWTDPNGGIWKPANFDGREHGQLSMLEALTRSLNLATVNLGLELGVNETRDYLRKLGLQHSPPAYPSIFLGAIELSPFELTELYTTLANDGFQVPLRAIFDVTGQNHKKLTRYGLKIRRVMEPATAALVRHAMTRVVMRGTARGLLRAFPDKQPLAGKTGTSDDNRDSWFAGFGANRLAVVWMGRDDNTVTGLTGASGALRLWTSAMQQAGLEALPNTLPAELAWQHVDLRRGVIVPDHCNNAERVPVHRRSSLRTMLTCTADTYAPPERTKRAGFIDRLRGFFD